MYDTFKRSENLDRRKKIQCNECRRQTIHTLEAECVGQWSQNFGPNSVDGGTDFGLYRCGACDSVCFEASTWCTEDFDYDDDGNMIFIRRELQYPPPSSDDFAFDTDFTPYGLNELIEEMIYALSGGKLRLATVALRMVIEFIVTDTKCAGANLVKKIDDLKAKGHVDANQLDLLHKIRQKGNDGAHELKPMKQAEMVAGIGLVNLLLEKLYNGPARQAEVIKKANQAFK